MPTDQTANPSKKDGDDLPDEERLKQAAASAQKALAAQSTAQSLKDAASSVTDPKKRERMLRDAYDKEIEAHGNSRKARMLSSGAFQGATGGAGIGGAVGLGVGTVVGTVVGGLTAIPTTALGALAGSGVGAIHGPFIKLPPIGGGKEGEGKKGAKADGKKAAKGESKKGAKGAKGDGKTEEKKDGDTIEEDEDVVPDPTALRQAADAVAEERARRGRQGDQSNGEGRKKPRKLEIRSKQQPQKED